MDFKNKGFTLIELLVVVAIIGLLSSVVLASLDGARAKAADTKAIQNLHQIQTALELYYNDNRKYPDEYSDNIDSLGPSLKELVDEGYISSIDVNKRGGGPATGDDETIYFVIPEYWNINGPSRPRFYCGGNPIDPTYLLITILNDLEKEDTRTTFYDVNFGPTEPIAMKGAYCLSD